MKTSFCCFCCSDAKKKEADGSGTVSKRHPPSKQFSKRSKVKAEKKTKAEKSAVSDDDSEVDGTGKDEVNEAEKKPNKKTKSGNPQRAKSGDKVAKPKGNKKAAEDGEQKSAGETKRKKKQVAKTSGSAPKNKKVTAKTAEKLSAEIPSSQPTRVEMSIQTEETVAPGEPLSSPGAKLDFYYNDTKVKAQPVVFQQSKHTYEDEFRKKIAEIEAMRHFTAQDYELKRKKNGTKPSPENRKYVLETDGPSSKKPRVEESEGTNSPPLDYLKGTEPEGTFKPIPLERISTMGIKGVGIFKLASLLGNTTGLQAFGISPHLPGGQGGVSVVQNAAVVKQNGYDTNGGTKNANQGCQANTWTEDMTQTPTWLQESDVKSDQSGSSAACQNMTQTLRLAPFPPQNKTRSPVHAQQPLINFSSMGTKPISAILQASQEKRALMKVTDTPVQSSVIPLATISQSCQAKNILPWKITQEQQHLMFANGSQHGSVEVLSTSDIFENPSFYINSYGTTGEMTSQVHQSPNLQSDHGYATSPMSDIKRDGSPQPPVLSPIPSPQHKILDQSPPHLISSSLSLSHLSELPHLEPSVATTEISQSLHNLQTMDSKNMQQPQSRLVGPKRSKRSSTSVNVRNSNVMPTGSIDTSSDHSSTSCSASSSRATGATCLDLSDLTPPGNIRSTEHRIMEILAQAQRLKVAQEKQREQQRELEAQVR